jgi:hypothetical protein
LSDEILRYATKRRELFDATVPEIRTPRGIVRMGSELVMATGPKESAAAVLDRLGFTGDVTMSFPEEMLRFDGIEEAEAEVAVIAETDLPADWTTAGFSIPPQLALPPDEARMATFFLITNRTRTDFEAILTNLRKKLTLPGNPDRPFQWSPQDFYVVAMILQANIVFVRGGRVVQWVTPNRPSKKYAIFWGPSDQLVSRGTKYVFTEAELPASMRDLLDAAAPMSVEEARGFVEAAPEVVAQVIPPPPAPEVVAEAAPEVVAEAAPEVVAEAAPEPAPEVVAEAAPEAPQVVAEAPQVVAEAPQVVAEAPEQKEEEEELAPLSEEEAPILEG